MKEVFANGESENRIAKKLKPFVGIDSLFGKRRVGDRFGDQALVLEMIAQHFFASLD